MAHVAAHELGAATYAITAARLAAPEPSVRAPVGVSVYASVQLEEVELSTSSGAFGDEDLA